MAKDLGRVALPRAAAAVVAGLIDGLTSILTGTLGRDMAMVWEVGELVWEVALKSKLGEVDFQDQSSQALYPQRAVRSPFNGEFSAGKSPVNYITLKFYPSEAAVMTHWPLCKPGHTDCPLQAKGQ